MRCIDPEALVKKSKKRKRGEDEDDYEQLLDVFEKEQDLSEFYNSDKVIRLDEVPQL